MKQHAKVKKKWNVPHTYVIIFMVIIFCALLTWVIPAGEYGRIPGPDDRTIVDVNDFNFVERNPMGPLDILASIPKGLQQSASIIFFIFITGGSFFVIQSTGAIESGVATALRALQGKDTILIPGIMLLMSILGFTIGASEETIAFIPIALLLAKGMGYDNVVGVAMISTGAAIGFTGGMLNPFTTGVAQSIAELPLYSGMTFRIVGYVIYYVIAVLYVLRYAKKVKADPKNSVLYGSENYDHEAEAVVMDHQMTTTHKLVLLVFVLGLGVMVWGVMSHGWYMDEIAATFLGVALVAGLIGGLSPSTIAVNFIAGAKDIAFGALVVGLARTILVILQEGIILDSIIYYLANGLASLPRQITAVGMFLVNSGINFFIPSGSGQAATLVPIMTPLADVLDITRQTAVLSVTYGDAISNQIIPTSGSLMACIGMAGISYDRWFKYNWKLMIYWTIVGAVLMAVASTIQLGPF